VLFNFCDADFSKNYVAESISQPAVARHLGIDPKFRIALVSEKDFAIVQQIETLARARGYIARAFSNKDEAAAWLKSC
jgi:hypothetical protein